MSKRIHLNVGGMTCINCQVKIENGLNTVDGVMEASVSFSKGTADILYDESRISKKNIIKVIEDLEYEVLSPKRSTSFDPVRSVSILVIILALYYMLQSLGILNRLVPASLADTGMGYGMLFVIGMITSVHCIAMCGGIGLSQSLPKKEDLSGNAGKLQAFVPTLSYNLGRVCSYTVIGFVFGLIGMIIGGGSDVGISSLLQGLLKIIAGLFMVVMGINMLGIFPWLRKFTIHTPKWVAKVIGKKSHAGNTPIAVGLLNGLMPCGPLQSMWIVALATGNPLAGALSMFLFSLGTVPLMLGLGSVVSMLGRKFTDQVMRVGAILVVVLGLSMLSQGGTLSGLLPSELLLYLIVAFAIAGILISLPNRKRWMRYSAYAASLIVILGAFTLWNINQTTEKRAEGEVQMVDGVQIVHSTLSSGSYPDITVREGIPVRWTIEAPEGSINGCNYRMLIQDYGIEHTFDSGENVIEFIPEKAGTVRYSCWMGMIHGNIYVADDTGVIVTENTPGVSDASASSCCGNSTDDAGGSSCCDVSDSVLGEYSDQSIPIDELAIASFTDEGENAGVQEVSVRLTDSGFSPAIIVVQRNQSVYWTIENEMADADGGTQIVVPYYATSMQLGKGINQLGLIPTESFDIATRNDPFFCYVKVVDDLSNIDESEIRDEVSAYQPVIYPDEFYESTGMSCCD